MTRVFISYRRDDAADVTGRIFDCLRAHFSKEVIFRDVDGIPIGHDFRKVIRKAVEECQVLLAVIGPTWVNVMNEDGARRLDDPHDFVRLEIETALTRDIPVVPLLVGRAGMPKHSHLPESLRELAFRSGLEIRRDPDFHNDVDRLIRGLNQLMGICTPRPADEREAQEELLQEDLREYEEELNRGQSKPYLMRAAPGRLTAWQRAAGVGHTIGMLLLADCCAEGVGVPQDDKKAVEWFLKAAQQGSAIAQNQLGWMYRDGRGVSQDDGKAVIWYHRAAEQGNVSAQISLGWMYGNGWGVSQNYEKAIEWYMKAAEQGNASAQCNLGWIYKHGWGVTRDDAKAVEWYRKAAEQGNPTAQFHIGLMYEEGKGVTQDQATAIGWYRKAHDQGDENAQKALACLGVT